MGRVVGDCKRRCIHPSSFFFPFLSLRDVVNRITAVIPSPMKTEQVRQASFAYSCDLPAICLPFCDLSACLSVCLYSCEASYIVVL